jgi:23S rRNA G2069 N7-methylase RlmK/C1962 C5-methylase RlmI
MLDDSSAPHRAASRRIRAGSDVDVDAYLLADGRFFLFCHIKDERLAGDDAYARSLAADFPDGDVIGVGRASKAKEGSRPLPAIWMTLAPPGEELWAVEDGLRFRLEPERVLNPGLFLDQRENRRRLVELVRVAAGSGAFGEDDGILNLFSFTGAFSLSARRGGAHLTTSVDVSPRYLAWERKNFDANFAEAGDAPRLLRGDARDFLRRAAKRRARYRFIVIDPPTFSRSEQGAFRVREHLVPMVKDALACLTEGRFGAVLVSANDAEWDDNDFLAEMARTAKDSGATIESGRTPSDFGPAHPLKSAWLIRS